MDPDFKAFLVAVIATPFAFALVAMVEGFGIFSLTKFGALQIIAFLVGFSFVASREYFKNKSK